MPADFPFFSDFTAASTAYCMEISVEKTKLMTNNTSGINTEIKVNGQKLETVTSYKNLGSIVSEPRWHSVPRLRHSPGYFPG